MERIRKAFSSPAGISITSSVLAAAGGLLFGLLLLLCFRSASAFTGFINILTTGFSSPAKLSKVLYQSAPLVLTGLSVGFAFKTGLFNIGATGQYIIGTLCALYTAIIWGFPWWAAMLAAAVGGAVWGSIPGICKALFNVNEVITSIMFNWIALYTIILVFNNTPAILDPVGNRTMNLAAANPGAIIPKWGLDELFGSQYMNISFFIAVAVAAVIYVVLNKTIFGYELKACGSNRDASRYAGINAKRNIILSMVISGALAGIAGAIYYLSGTVQYNLEKNLPSPAMGFNGIPVALLAASHPLGTVFSALFISYIQVGGETLQPTFAKENIDIIISVIIYFSAFAMLTRMLLQRLLSHKKESGSKAVPAAVTAAGAVPGEDKTTADDNASAFGVAGNEDNIDNTDNESGVSGQ